ncbi:histidine-containing phosphotransfer protein 1-like [Hibiscus syriacus]|uniref:Histidine-containing phosphotransfer protein 1-like n=1 Tax=Hibiscus syriacus TaxID=106335 RepID=A0A6A2YQL0_HIBSY|nr:NAC domain-containing protein 59-like [Hibiscus syriacus]KAE8681694.1 histidine-containing phosphotransfer protein 1-like [Hibiscus syriacus]
MRNKKGYHIIRSIVNEERFSNYYCYYLFWVAVGYYLWKKILSITGYRFHPTDFELLHFYLQNKNLGRDSLVQAIAEVEDICGLEPWQLPGHSNIHSGDQVWYFFYRPSFKYRNSSRINRTTSKGYWKPTGKPRQIMARDMKTVIGKKKTLVFYKGRVGDQDKIKTGWIMNEYELNSTDLSNQTTFVLCKLKRKFGKDEVSCIEECQSSHYLPPNLGNYIENNANEAEAARCLTDKEDPNKMLEQVEVLDEHQGLEHQSMELWNSYLVSGSPSTGGTGSLPFVFGNLVAEYAIPNLPSVTGIPIEQEVPQDQSSTNEQGSNLGNLLPADERSNRYHLVIDNDGSTMPSNSRTDTAEDSVQIDLSNLAGPSMDEIFGKLEALEEVQGNSCGQTFDDWTLDAGISEDRKTPDAFDNQPSINEEQHLTCIDSLCCAGMMNSPHAVNMSRKRLRTDDEDLVWTSIPSNTERTLSPSLS